MLRSTTFSKISCDCNESSYESRTENYLTLIKGRLTLLGCINFSENAGVPCNVLGGATPAAGTVTWPRGFKLCDECDQARSGCRPGRVGAGAMRGAAASPPAEAGASGGAATRCGTAFG